MTAQKDHVLQTIQTDWTHGLKNNNVVIIINVHTN